MLRCHNICSSKLPLSSSASRCVPLSTTHLSLPLDHHPEGWLHSGDKGMLDPTMGNMLKITGRVKELLITAGGENVAPVPIEDSLKTLLPAVSQVITVER